MMKFNQIRSFVILATAVFWVVDGHARLTEPPSRASMWRFGFNNPVDYNDNEANCGGIQAFGAAGNRCGTCGDSYTDPVPRKYEVGGKYGNNILVRNYTKGQVINVKVEVTANHKGFFRFKICPRCNKEVEATQKCLDSYDLELAGQPGKTKYPIKGETTGNFDLQLQLPADITCSICTFQWTYTGGNNYGVCEDGSGQIGCGDYQDTFRACADVSIT